MGHIKFPLYSHKMNKISHKEFSENFISKNPVILWHLGIQIICFL